jgi:hypothetical protein
MSKFPRLFCFIAFSDVSQRWEFKDTTKNSFTKKSDCQATQHSATPQQQHSYIGHDFHLYRLISWLPRIPNVLEHLKKLLLTIKNQRLG